MSIMDDRYTIDTPENIEFAFDIAGIGSRFLAALIDIILLGLLELILLIIMFALDALLFANIPGGTSVILAIRGVLVFMVVWGYYIAFELLWNGQSPGKRAIGLRVVREGGRPITFVSSALRNLIRIVDFLPSFYGIGVIVMFIDRRARRLGDLAGGTLVIKERQSVTLASLTAKPLTEPSSTLDANTGVTLPNIDRLNDQDYNLVQEFLQRRTELGRDARARLGIQLAGGLQTRLGITQGGDAERFLQYVAHEYRHFKLTQEQP